MVGKQYSKFIGTRLTTQIDLQSFHDGCSETTELKVSLEFRAFLTTCQETPHFFSMCLRVGKCECACVRERASKRVDVSCCCDGGDFSG